MESYNSVKGKGSIFLVILTVLVDLIILFLAAYINSYLLVAFFRVFLIIFNIYQLYYILLCSTIKYNINDDGITILAFKGLKKIKIPFTSIVNYDTSKGEIDGVRLSGIGKGNFALGRFVIKNIGIVNMFVTSNKNVFYIKTKENIIAISPENYKDFEVILSKKGIAQSCLDKQIVKQVSLYKDKQFIIPFIIVAIIIIILTLNPFILYLKNKLPVRMPVSFNSKFIPVEYGTETVCF